MHGAAGGEHSPELFDGAAGLREMFKRDGGNHAIECRIGKRQIFHPGNRIQFRVIPVAVALSRIDSDITRVGELRLKSVFAGARIEDSRLLGRGGGGFGDELPDACFEGIEAPK